MMERNRTVRFESVTSDIEKGPRRSTSSSRRSNSGEGTFMSPLSFEEIDLKNTPLSSLRSCSEFQKNKTQNELLQTQNDQEQDLKASNKSFWSSLFGFGSGGERTVSSAAQNVLPPSSSPTPKNQKLKLSEADPEEALFLVEKFRFNPDNLYEGEDYYYSNSDAGDEIPGYTFTPPCLSVSFSSGGDGNMNLFEKRKRQKSAGASSSSSSSIFGESAAAFDYLFGVKFTTPAAMEIELKCLNNTHTYRYSDSMTGTTINEDFVVNSSIHTTTTRNSNETVSGALETNPQEIETDNSLINNITSLRRIPSLRSLESTTVIQVGEGVEIRSRVTSDAGEVSNTVIVIDSTTQLLLLPAVFKQYWNHFITILRIWFPVTRGDESFYESIRLQPFSSGSYLRCMLLAGVSSMVFQMYNYATWPSGEQQLHLSGVQSIIEFILYINLIAQIIFSLFQLPFRLRIHFLCWESSRALEVDAAITIIRDMLQSDSWLINKALGKIIDITIIFNLIMTELYLWLTSRTDPLRSLLISLCATNMLTVVARVFVATVFSFSMHDPQVLSEARKRGLSKWDLEVLPTFVYSKSEEVNNSDCPICLCSFDMGEMLISLPCDAKHSFHAACIRQWLQRQNSCPLCQKIV